MPESFSIFSLYIWLKISVQITSNTLFFITVSYFMPYNHTKISLISRPCMHQAKWCYFNFVGELGWELFHNKNYTAQLYEALLRAGEDYGIGDFGTYAVNSLRLEKGFHAWGYEVQYYY